MWLLEVLHIWVSVTGGRTLSATPIRPPSLFRSVLRCDRLKGQFRAQGQGRCEARRSRLRRTGLHSLGGPTCLLVTAVPLLLSARTHRGYT